MSDMHEFLRKALRLSPEARAAIAGSLLDRLDERLDTDALARWEDEVGKRLRELDSGAVAPVPWSEARRVIAGE